MPDKRSVDRIPIAGGAGGEATVFHPMTILDITERGARIEAAYPLRNDSLHDFRLMLNGPSVVLKGRIVYCQVGDLRAGIAFYRCGVEFVNPPAHVLDAIREFVTHQESMPAGVIEGQINAEI
jgi:hypothetical protein